MTKRIFLLATLCASFFLHAQQSTSTLDQITQQFRIEHTPYTLGELHITDQHYNPHNKTTYIYTQQLNDGIEVKNAIGIAVQDENGTVTTITQTFKDLSNQSRAPIQYSLDNCLNSLIYNLNRVKSVSIPKAEKLNNGYLSYKMNSASSEPILAKPIYFPDHKDNLHHAYEINIWLDKEERWSQQIISSTDQSTLGEFSWTVSCNQSHSMCKHDKVDRRSTQPLSTCPDSSYHVFAMPIESPLYGSRTIETKPWNAASNASPFGWHDLDGIAGSETTVTHGNNVQAYEDTNDDNQVGNMPDGGATLCFDFPFDDSMDPSTYLDAATVNLFYWNNIVHDVTYQYGFTEDAGNFQNTNYTGQGSGSDFVLAEAQDGGGTNNANFSTPPDGSNPRMQMYNWQISSSPDTFEVLSPAGVAGLYNALSGNFGPTNVSVLDTLVLAVPNEACSAITNTNDIAGQIAVIDRGNCTFVNKVQAAQDAGAVAAVICNNVTSPIFAMGGNSNTITIPSVMLSQADCNTIKAAMPDVVIEMSLGGSQFRDSDFDNGVIIHEYGHGVSNRLTGGGSNTSCLFNEEQMGEGWSDYLGLIMTIEPGDSGTDSRGIGNYLLDQGQNGGGIRPLPYSTDPAINDHTYADISTVSVPHGVGSIWCVMLWDMTWALIDEYGYDPDIYNGTGGNNIAFQLVMDGLKLQACNPGFVDGRDAILLADQLNNSGANQCLIWEVFANRGLGYSADQGSTNDVNDGSEAFDLPLLCQEVMAVNKSAEEVITKSDTLEYSIYAFNNSGNDVMTVTIEDVVPSNTTYLSGSLNAGTESAGVITVPIANFTNGTDSLITFKVTPNSTTTSIDYYEDFETGSSGWNAIQILGSDGFQLSTSNPNSGTQSWFIQDVGADNTHSLESPDFTLSTDAALSLWHSFDTESGWDGGLVEYSDNGGSTWNSLEDYVILGKYTGVIGASSNNDIANKPGWSGNSGGYINSVISLSHLSGMTIRLRLFYGSDNNTFSDGWYIDDISIYAVPEIQNVACINSPTTLQYCDTVWTHIVTDCPTFYKLYQDSDGDGYGIAVDSMYSCNTSEPGFALSNDDCDDNDASVNPGANEVCNLVDDDCNGQIDEGGVDLWYADSDGDGYGDINEKVEDCSQPAGYVNNPDDCDDNNANINPDASELCNLIDDNCNGLVDEVCSGSLICQDDILYISMNDQMHVIADSLIFSGTLLNLQDSTFFYAGDTITLEPGFETLLGKEFNAIIEGCSN